MKETSWRAACDKWVCNFLEDRKGASTPIFQLYNSYIENNRDSYMDIGQFGKVLRSWFPHRKRRRGKQGSQIYVYQDVALKPRVTPRPRQNKDLPQDPSSIPLKTYCRGGHAKSFSLLNPSQHGPLSVPSMMVGNQKVGPILVSIPEGACTASSTTDGLEDRSECMVSLPTSEPKRKYEEESSGNSLLAHKKKKFSDEDTDPTDDSSLLLKDEIKNEIEFEEESCLQLDHFLSQVPCSQPLPSNEDQKESGTVPMPPLEPVNTRHRKFRRTKHPHTSCKDMMALARQWVDANLIDKKGATTAASVFFEAYVRDNPDKHLPQNSLAVVIRGKFPTRRKPVKQDSKVEYYYQDLELVKHGDISALYPSYLGTATYGSSVVAQVSTDQSGVEKNNKTEALSTMKNITAQERRPNITKKSKGMEDIVKSKRETQAKVNPRKKRARSSKVTPGKRGRPSLITRSENRLLAVAAGNEENCVITEGKEKERLFTTEGKEKERLITTEGKEKRRQATETERAKVNPVIFTDTDRGIPVAVANPPSESVFSYQGVPCVMIPINHTSNINPHAQDPTVLANVKGRAVAKMISVSQQVLTHSNETRKDSKIIPSNSQTVNSVIPAPLTTSVKSIKLKNNMTDSTHPSYPILQGKIQIKTVASINATDFSSFVNNETSKTSTCLVGREHFAAVSSSAGKKKQILSNFEEKQKSAVQRSYINKNSSDIQGPVDENNDISCQPLNVRAPVISPSLRPLPDMDVLDYIKSEMAEDDEYVSANIRMKSSKNMISNSFDTPGNAVITHNNDVFMSESQLMDLDRNITAEMISEHMTGMTSCDSEMAKQCKIIENTVHEYDGDVQENSENVENRPVCVITEVKSQSIQGNDSGTLSEREAVSFSKNVENEVNENETHSERESADNQAEMYKTSTQLEGGMEKTRRDKSISKVDQKVASTKKIVRRWDEDIRSFVGESDTVSRYKDSKIPKKRRKKKIKEGNLHQTVAECSSAPVNSSRKNPRHSELPKNTHSEKYESMSGNSETRLPLSEKTFDENHEQVREHNEQNGEKVKRAVLSVTFELLSEAASVLTEIERAQKLEGALFDENPAVHYNTRNYSNINKDSQEYFPCIPSSALEDLKLCSYDQSTQLLQHHQACPQLGCQECCILRAAYVHITLLRHRCQVWHTFTKIISRHSRACRTVECPVLFCQYMKHELHLSGVSVLCNHHLDESAQLEAEFAKCLKAGTHEAVLHCSHQQEVSLPVPRMTKGGCQQQLTHGVEARGLKVMSDLLMPDRPRAYDITTPILHTLHIAAAHHEQHSQSKE